jgi:hypothetical protein
VYAWLISQSEHIISTSYSRPRDLLCSRRGDLLCVCLFNQSTLWVSVFYWVGSTDSTFAPTLCPEVMLRNAFRYFSPFPRRILAFHSPDFPGLIFCLYPTTCFRAVRSPSIQQKHFCGLKSL